MNFSFKISALAVLLFSCTTFGYSQKDASEKEKIQMLIQSIEELEDAEFFRNGSTYSAERAAEHLRMKLRKAGSKIKTAEQFIEKLASESSFSGSTYYIIFDDGHKIPSREFLMEELREIENGKESD